MTSSFKLVGLGTTTTTTVLWPSFRDHPGEPVPEENLWTLWCKGRLTEADTLTIRLGTTLSRLTSAHLHHPPYFLRAGCPSCHSINRVKALKATSAFGLGKKTLKFSSTVLPAPSPYLWALEDRQICADLVEVYKMINGFTNVKLEAYFEFDTDPHTQGHTYKLKKKCFKRDLRHYFFTERTINFWNSLDEQVVSASSLHGFKQNLE